MLYRCLAILGIPIVAICLLISGNDDLLIGLWLVSIPTTIAIAKLVERRHRRAIRSQGALYGITNIQITRGGGFVTPGDHPWYVGWSSYDVEADDRAGLRRKYMAYLTWTWFGLVGIEVSFSTVEDYECYDASRNRIHPSSIIEDSEERGS